MAEDLLHDGQALCLVQAVGGLHQNFGQIWSNQGLGKALQPQLERSSQLHASQDSFSNAVNVVQLTVPCSHALVVLLCKYLRAKSDEAQVGCQGFRKSAPGTGFHRQQNESEWAAAEDKDSQREDLNA